MTGFQGVHLAAITPRGKQGEIDLGATFELIDHLSKAGAAGIVLFSDAGEYPAFTVDERSRLVYLAVKRSRVPVLVGVGSATVDLSVELARAARYAGAEALLLPPPFFYRYDADDLHEFYCRYAALSGTVDETFVWNAPEWTSAIPMETAVDLVRSGGFAGIQDSSGSLENFSWLQSAASQQAFPILVAHDGILTRTRCARVAGAVSAAGCAVPELVTALDRAVAKNRSEEVAQLDQALREFLDWERQFPRPIVLKVATGLRGIKTGSLSVPLSPAKEKMLAAFREWFQGWLPTVKKMSANV